MSQMLHDPAYLAIPPFTDGDGQPGIACHLPVQPGRHPAIADAVNGDAVGKRLQCRRVDLALDPHPVFSAPAGAWKFQMPGQAPIIGQQQKAFGIKIKSPDGKHPWQ